MGFQAAGYVVVVALMVGWLGGGILAMAHRVEDAGGRSPFLDSK